MNVDRHERIVLESLYTKVSKAKPALVEEAVVNPHPDKVQALLNKAVKEHADKAVNELVAAGIIKDPTEHSAATEILIRHFELSIGHVDETEAGLE